ncbi:MAG: L-lysine 6-transaminase [bacterium]|nr:L-lysine 6-transaminase [bacterium]
MQSYTPRFAVSPENVLSELRQNMLVDGFEHILDMERSHGAYLVEQRTGKAYLDFFTCIASMPIGMNHPRMTDPAFVEFLGRIALHKPSNSDIYNVHQATFDKTFRELAISEHFRYAFFIDGGTLAVENALKAAFDWKVQKNFAKGHLTEKGHSIIHFERAFHGRSGYALSLTNTDPSKTKFFPQFNWPRITPPIMSFPATDEVLQRVIEAEAHAVAQMKQAFIEDPDNIAAIIIEPIQGEGGDNHFRPEFFRALRELADENDCLLIFDEVQTGVGLTGTMWAHEGIGVKPDIMAFGKKMQVCGIVASERLSEIEDNVFVTSSRINSTWGGSLVDMVRATKYLEIIDDENLVQNAATQGAYLQERIAHLENARGRGLFCAFDMPTPEARGAVLKGAYEKGLILVGCGTRSVRLRPPLNITRAQIDDAVAIIECVV